MARRSGSVWIENGKICYIDNSDEKQCQDFSEINNIINKLQNDVKNLKKDVDKKTSNSFFAVTIIETNSPVEGGEDIIVNVRVNNTGGSSSTQNIEFIVDGEVLNTESVELQGNSQTTIEFSESYDFGNSDTATVEISTDDDSTSETIDVDKAADFGVSITSTNSPVNEENTLTVSADITNNSSKQETQKIKLSTGGTVRDTGEVTLQSSSIANITLEWSDSDAGNYTAKVESVTDSDTTSVTVNKVDGSFFDVSITDVSNLDNTDISEGDDIKFTCDIQNIGDTTETNDVALNIDGETEDSQSVSVSSGSTESIVLRWDNSDAGSYTPTVSSENGNSDSVSLDVLISGQDFFGVRSISTNSPVSSGSVLNVDFVVKNVGDESGTQTVGLGIKTGSGNTFNTVDSRKIQLSGGSSKSIRLSSEVSGSGKQTLRVFSDDDEVQQEFLIADSSVDGQAGVIIHNSPGETISGVQVDKDAWVEVFGEEVHFSRTD